MAQSDNSLVNEVGRSWGKQFSNLKLQRRLIKRLRRRRRARIRIKLAEAEARPSLLSKLKRG